LVADRLQLSGVLTIVTFAIILSRRSSSRMPAAVRVPSYAVWETVVFLLNALAFVMVGLQIGPILQRIGPAERISSLTFAGAILLTAMLARIGWVVTYNRSIWLINRILGRLTPRALTPVPLRGSLVVAWCGMRGIVTLAAALALPNGSDGGAAFPYRDLIVLTAFIVVIGTLVIEGLTLRPLLGLLGLQDDDATFEEARAARAAMLRAALETLDDADDDVAGALREEFIQLLGRVDGSIAFSDEARSADIALRSRARGAARERLSYLRLSGTIGDSTFQLLEAELDLVELDTEARSRW